MTSCSATAPRRACTWARRNRRAQRRRRASLLSAQRRTEPALRSANTSLTIAAHAQQALRDAIYAEQLLRIQPGNVDAAWLRALAKACFLQARLARRVLLA
jgi:hypothetical protein